jgi:hypothetical protein
LPERAVLVDPLLQRGESRRFDRARPHAPDFLRADQTAFLNTWRC